MQFVCPFDLDWEHRCWLFAEVLFVRLLHMDTVRRWRLSIVAHFSQPDGVSEDWVWRREGHHLEAQRRNRFPSWQIAALDGAHKRCEAFVCLLVPSYSQAGLTLLTATNKTGIRNGV